MGNTQRDPDRTVAWFDRLEDVRRAEVELERRGIEPGNLRVEGVDTVRDRNKVDNRSFGWIGRRAVTGAVIGAAIGAVVGAAIGAILGYAGTELVAFVVAGTIFGVAPGFFYTVGSRLPAHSEAFDTFADETPCDHWISISGPPEVHQQAAEVLSGLDPVRLDRAA